MQVQETHRLCWFYLSLLTWPLSEISHWARWALGRATARPLSSVSVLCQSQCKLQLHCHIVLTCHRAAPSSGVSLVAWQEGNKCMFLRGSESCRSISRVLSVCFCWFACKYHHLSLRPLVVVDCKHMFVSSHGFTHLSPLLSPLTLLPSPPALFL